MNTFPPLLRTAAPALLLSLSAACAFAAPLQVDPAALALLQKVQTATQKTQSLTADFTDVYFYHNPEREMRSVGNLKLMKPNYAFDQMWDQHKDKATGKWVKDADSMTHTSDDGGNMPTFDFFDPSQSVLAQVKKQQAKGQLIALTYSGTQTWEGHTYKLVDWEYKSDYPFDDETTKKAPGGVVTVKDRLFIGADNLVYRLEDAYNVGWSCSRSLRNVKVNAPLTAANFKFTLPPGAHLPEPPKPLLAVGTPAPDFAATAPNGSMVHLSDYRGKTVVLDFWSTWCGPCQMSMPHLEKVYQAVKDKNVAVLGVCVWDQKPEYDKWIVAKKDTYHFPTAFDPAGRGAKSIASDLYHVSGIPTQYVIDKDGKIAASTVGYDAQGTELEDALKKQGAEMSEGKTAARP